MGRFGSTLLQVALPQSQLLGQDADALHISAQRNDREILTIAAEVRAAYLMPGAGEQAID